MTPERIAELREQVPRNDSGWGVVIAELLDEVESLQRDNEGLRFNLRRCQDCLEPLGASWHEFGTRRRGHLMRKLCDVCAEAHTKREEDGP